MEHEKILPYQHAHEERNKRALTKVTAEGSPTTGTVRPFGLDCSGYVARVFVNAAVTADVDRLGYDASSKYAACTQVSWNQAQPGDLAFYSDLSHVGIVVRRENGNLLIANCSSNQNNVIISSVSSANSSGFYMISRYSSMNRPLFIFTTIFTASAR
jgi:cell wall-associated NlpC family hydrolase